MTKGVVKMMGISKKEILLKLIKFIIFSYFVLFCNGDGSLPSASTYLKFLGKTLSNIYHIIDNLIKFIIKYKEFN